jgi:hypothetical protein
VDPTAQHTDAIAAICPADSSDGADDDVGVRIDFLAHIGWLLIHLPRVKSRPRQ